MVISFVRGKYGAQSVSQIVTFGTMAARAVVRDAGRVLDLPFLFCDAIAKLIPFQPGKVVTLRRREGEGASPHHSVRAHLERRDERSAPKRGREGVLSALVSALVSAVMSAPKRGREGGAGVGGARVGGGVEGAREGAGGEGSGGEGATG